ncbi:hypothetical protein EDB92DRAFT_1890941 [Lactarius akahatsu]|uniref:Uncharacterized protein n=1 Tax=Lactarius akahatsu TaxID=416441 RepID=A0AAD4LCN0_9AGAM|nr:hypothetical protein EDB92DRAFT_1890941 [Lactarius akahatsu]
MSYRSDGLGGYDHTLLSSVPDPTRAEKQEGYNVDLLEESRDRRAPSPPTNGAASDHNGTLLDYSPGAIGLARKEDPITATTNDYEPVEKRVPWYRTRKGLIGIVVVVLVIIAAAVGGGVGGTRHSSHPANNNATTNGVGQSANNSTQGVGSSNSTSSSTTSPPSNTIGQAETTSPLPSGGTT